MRRRGWLRAIGAVVVGGVAALVPPVAGSATSSSTDFPMYMHDAAHTSLSSDATVTVANASSLKLAFRWTPDRPSVSGAPGRALLATPVVVGGVIYIGSKSGDFYAVNEATGAVIWKKFLGFEAHFNCGAEGFVATAIVAPDPSRGNQLTVYAASGDGNLYALKAADGTQVWAHPVNVPTKGTDDNYNWSSPELANGKIYIGLSSNCDRPLDHGGLMAVDQASGAQHAVYYTIGAGASSPLGGSIWSSPVVAADGSVFVTTGNGLNGALTGDVESIVHLDGNTLAKLDSWQLTTAGADGDFGGSPTLFTGTSGTMVGACNKDGNFYAWNASSLHSGPVWTRLIGSPPGTGGGNICIAGAAWDGSGLYVASNTTTVRGTTFRGAIRRLDPNTGNPVWETGLPVGIISSPTVNGAGLIGLNSDDGAAKTLNSAFLVNKTTGAIVTTVSSGGLPGFAEAVFADGSFFVTSQKSINAYHP